jgi:hypothetical protein
MGGEAIAPEADDIAGERSEIAEQGVKAVHRERFAIGWVGAFVTRSVWEVCRVCQLYRRAGRALPAAGSIAWGYPSPTPCESPPPTAISTTHFAHGLDVDAQLASLKKTSEWEQAAFIKKGGWDTLSGLKETVTGRVYKVEG